jgi:hypothetical protein
MKGVTRKVAPTAMAHTLAKLKRKQRRDKNRECYRSARKSGRVLAKIVLET